MIEKVARRDVLRWRSRPYVRGPGRLARTIILATLPVSLALLLFLPLMITAQTRQTGPWWPQPQWGPEDQAGASNWITETKILRAVRLVTTGKTYELGHVYERGMPLYGDRTFSLVRTLPACAFLHEVAVANERRT